MSAGGEPISKRIFGVGMRLIGCALADRERAVLLSTTLGSSGEHYFPNSEQGKFYASIYSLIGSGRDVDMATVGDHYAKRGGSDFRLLTSCGEEAFTGDYGLDLETLVQVYQWRKMRELFTHAARIADDEFYRETRCINTPHDAIKWLLNDYEQLMEETARSRRALRAHEMLYRAQEYAATIARGEPVGWKFGIPVLDRALRIEPGALYVIGAESKAGKSKLAVWLGHRISSGSDADDPAEVYHCSLEMPREQVWDWYVSLELGIDSHQIGHENMPSDVVDELLDAAHPIYTHHLTIDDTVDCTVGDLSLRVREWKLTTVGERPGLVIVDYVQLLDEYINRPKGEGTADAVKRIGYSLHRLAQRENVAIVALAQLNRTAHTAESCGTEHLEGGNGLLQAARSVMVLDNVAMRIPIAGLRVPATATPIWFQIAQRGSPSWRGKMVADLTTGSWRDAERCDEKLIHQMVSGRSRSRPKDWR